MDNNLLDIIKNRRSIRAFQEKEVPQELIDKLIEALIWAPSAGNLQSRRFYFILDKVIKKELVETALRQSFVEQAPLIVVCCIDLGIAEKYGEKGRNLYSVCDVSASIQNMMLLSQEQGLGTCWIGAFDEEKVSKVLKLPENLKPIAIVPVGYPAESPLPPLRTSKEKAVKIVK